MVKVISTFDMDHMFIVLGLEQGWATIFVRGPQLVFICVSRAKFVSNMPISKLKM